MLLGKGWNQVRPSMFCCKIMLLLASCSDAGNEKSIVSDANIGASSVKSTVSLGNGYSEKTGSFLTNECVSGEVEEKNLPLTGSDISFITDASYTDIVDSLSGSLEGSLDLAVIKASAGAELAKKTAKTRLTTNIYAYINLIGQSKSFKSGSRKIGSDAMVAGLSKEKYCGTDFVNQIDYGASMAVSFEVTAKTEAQKNKIAGYLKVNYLDMIEANGSLEKIDDEEKSDYSIRLMIKQVGGKPQNIALAVPGDGIFCGINDIKQCIDKMNVALNYMRTQLRSDLEDSRYWNPINYHTISYKNAASVRLLAPQELTQNQKNLLARAHDYIRDQYLKIMEDLKDADTISDLELNSEERSHINRVPTASNLTLKNFHCNSMVTKVLAG